MQPILGLTQIYGGKMYYITVILTALFSVFFTGAVLYAYYNRYVIPDAYREGEIIGATKGVTATTQLFSSSN